jgi:hypothetical protein
MKLLAFHSDANAGGPLIRCGEETAKSFADDAEPWQRMKREIEETAPLINNYTDRQWQERFARGHAAIVVAGRQILAHVSLIDLTPLSRRQRAAAHVGQAWPWFGVWESATGWTHPDLRRKGLQRFLRRLLYERAPSQDLLVSFCIGTAASPVLSELGWAAAPWSEFPIVAALMGGLEAGGLRLYQGSYRSFGNRKLYLGSGRYPDAKPLHDWETCVHLWVRDAAQAQACEAAFRGNPANWLRALAAFDE